MAMECGYFEDVLSVIYLDRTFSGIRNLLEQERLRRLFCLH